jgi:hypothetical protein
MSGIRAPVGGCCSRCTIEGGCAGSARVRYCFGPAPEAGLRYALVSRSQDTCVSVHHRPQKVTVILSPEQLRMWNDEKQVGVYANLNLGVAGYLEIAVEKDFACLERSDKDNTDTFANPYAERGISSRRVKALWE